MKKEITILVCMIFAAGIIICNNAFAQRSVNSAQEAAMKAKDSLRNQPEKSSSQIEWLNQVINVINMKQSPTEDKKPSPEDVKSKN